MEWALAMCEYLVLLSAAVLKGNGVHPLHWTRFEKWRRCPEWQIRLVSGVCAGDDNEQRPRNGLGGRTPAAYERQLKATTESAGVTTAL